MDNNFQWHFVEENLPLDGQQIILATGNREFMVVYERENNNQVAIKKQYFISVCEGHYDMQIKCFFDNTRIPRAIHNALYWLPIPSITEFQDNKNLDWHLAKEKLPNSDTAIFFVHSTDLEACYFGHYRVDKQSFLSNKFFSKKFPVDEFLYWREIPNLPIAVT